MTAPWTIPKKKPRTSPMSTRNVITKHLKEWNMDDDESHEEYLKRVYPGMEEAAKNQKGGGVHHDITWDPSKGDYGN